MKKRILTLVMVLVLMVAVSVMGVSADDVAPQAETGKQMWSNLTVANDGLTATGYCPHCGDDTSVMQTWTKLTLSTDGKSISVTATGHYFLDADYEGKAAINLGAENVDVVLHLNGRTYKRTGNDGGSGALCTAKSNTTVSIVDDRDQKGTIHGSGGWAVYDYGAPSSNYTTNTEVNLYSGNLTSQVTTIPSGNSNSNGGTVCMTSGTFNMFGGTINGTKATYGGAIYTKAGKAQGSFAKVNIHGGTINGGEVQRGGAIYADGGAQVTISGGTINGGKATYGGALYITSGATTDITGGTVTGGQAASRGGNIYMASPSCTLDISSGTIQNGRATSGNGGNICANNGKLDLAGGTVSGGQAARGGNIYTNTVVTDATPNNRTTITGGVILADGKATYGGNLYVNRHVTLDDVDFQNGMGTTGSDIYVSDTGRMIVNEAFAGEAGVYYGMSHLHDVVLGDTLATDKNFSNANTCGNFTGTLYLENEEGKPTIYPDNGMMRISGVALMGKNGTANRWYTTNAEAVENYDENTKYMKVAAGNLVLSGRTDYVVDLAGNNVAITGSGSVKIFDSANADYKTYGTATVDGPTVLNNFKETVNGAVTYMVRSGNQYSFHRLGMEIVTLGVGSDDAGMYYEGVWHCDDALAGQVQSFGVAVALNSMPGTNFKENPLTYTEFTTGFEPGVPFKGVRILGIMKEDATNNADRSNRQVYAAPYITFADGTTVMSTRSTHYSLCDALETVEENIYHYWTQEEELLEFHNTWKESADWDFNFALSEDERALLEAYSGRTAYHGEAHDHSASGGNSDGTYTLNQWKKTLKQKNMDFTTILDHKQWSHMRDPGWDSSLFIGGSEASTQLQGGSYKTLSDAGKSVQMHYSMIFPEYSDALEGLTAIWHSSSLSILRPFNYEPFTAAQVKKVIDEVKAAGGMFVHVHPKAEGYLDSDNIEDYYFADGTGLEVFYGANGYAPNQQVSKDNYDLWVALLKAGKKIWATAGTDLHTGATTNALTTLYATDANATEYFNCMAAGNTTCGGVGIRMSINGALMGSQVETAFTEDQKVIFSVGDFHESVYNSNRTYTAKLYKGVSGDEVLVEEYTITNPQKGFIAAEDVETDAEYYRVEVWDSSVSNLPIAIGNPIWNN